MTPDNLPIGSRIEERDIDLLLAEELRCSRSFQKWLLREVEIDGLDVEECEIEHVEVRHSVNHPSGSGKGESDLVVDFTFQHCGARHFRVHIEDKIDAQFQPDQADRYLKRAAADERSGDWDRSVAVIVAPRRYLKGKPSDVGKFHGQVPFEDIIDFFNRAAHQAHVDQQGRYAQGIQLLTQAIEQHRTTAVKVPDEAVREFWDAYATEAATCGPSSSEISVGERSQSSSLISFIGAVESPFRLAHKIPKGYVQLRVDRWGACFNAISSRLNRLRGRKLIPRVANQMLSFDIEVPKLSMSEPFAKQIDDARVGIKAAAQLQEWYRLNRNALAEIGEEVERLTSK